MSASTRRIAAPVVALILALIVGVPAALAAFPGANGKIVFQRGSDSRIYTVQPNGSALTQLTTFTSYGPAWSPDGSKIAFWGVGAGGLSDIFVMTAAGGGITNVTSTSTSGEAEPAWSHDGSQILFTGESTGADLFVMDADGSDRTQITTDQAFNAQAVWSPDGTRIAYITNPAYPEGDFDIATMNPDGTGRAIVAGGPANDISPDWSPDGAAIVFARDETVFANEHDVWLMNADGTEQTRLTATPGIDMAPAYSPDGTQIVFQDGFPGDLLKMNIGSSGRTNVTNDSVNDGFPDWRPVATSPSGAYVRPKGATPIRVSLVPGFNSCTAPNRTHGEALHFPSCNPPVASSSAVTIGTLDNNGAEANSEASLKLTVQAGNQGPPEDSDVVVQGSVSDVRCKGGTSPCGGANAAGGSDYVGQLQASGDLRLTDRDYAASPGPGSDGATMVDLPFPFRFTCSTTASVDEGGTCTSNTSVNAIVPGSVKDGKRAIWQFGQVTVSDGGPDGMSDTVPNTVFMRQGVFVP